MGESPGWAARIGTMLFSGVFMVGFGGVGLFFGLLPLLDTAWQMWTVRSWVPVSAQVLDVQLDQRRGSKGSVTYQLVARYAYRFDGRDHESTRVGLERQMGADNIGDWHQRWHARLSDARANEQPVAAWVDPRRPSQAVLERRVRWGLALFRVPFAVLFTAVGVGAALIFGFALLGLPTRRRQLSSSAARSSKSAAATGASAGREAAVAQRPGGRDLPPLPPGVRGVLQGPGATLHFVRRWPQVGAAVLVLGVLAWLLASLGGGASGPVGLVLRALSGTAGLALALHLATLRWTWRLDAGTLEVDRGSWLRDKRLRLDRRDLRSLSHQLVYSSSTNRGPMVEHRRLLAHPPGGPKLALTPALAGTGSAQVLAWHLQQALDASARLAPDDDGAHMAR
jgi:hypothetical protein